MTRIITVALTLLGLTLFGCSDQKAEWYGTWQGEMNLAHPSIKDENIKRSVNMVRLTINPGDTFSLFIGGMASSGKHFLNGDKATLKITEIAGSQVAQHGKGAEKMNKDIIVKMQEDGTILLFDEFYDDPIAMTKLPQP